LRFVPISADVQTGDELVTSGLDGVYPPGLAVARVVRVDKQADTAFARVVCLPIAPVRGAGQLLVLHYEVNLPPNPVEVEAAAAAKEAKENKGKKPAKPAAAKPASGAVTAEPASAALAASAAATATARKPETAAKKPETAVKKAPRSTHPSRKDEAAARATAGAER